MQTILNSTRENQPLRFKAKRTRHEHELCQKEYKTIFEAGGGVDDSWRGLSCKTDTGWSVVPIWNPNFVLRERERGRVRARAHVLYGGGHDDGACYWRLSEGSKAAVRSGWINKWIFRTGTTMRKTRGRSKFYKLLGHFHGHFLVSELFYHLKLKMT